ncbi:MAG: NAD(+) diphosphatase [Pseudomonadota bacterium]
MRHAEHVTFGGSGLERVAQRRPDPALMEALANDPQTRMLPMWRGKPLVRDTAEADGSLRLATVAPGAAILSEGSGERVYLGYGAGSDLRRDPAHATDGPAWFAVEVSDWEPEGQEAGDPRAFADPTEQVYPGLPEGHRFVELRGAMTRLSARDAELAATAKGVLGWHQTHRYCARCGHPSDLSEGGWQRRCSACGARHFPRTDPVVIMLITCGNTLLLGRSPGWPDRMYSLLAGFIEPGETMEAAVRREVFEEAGVRVGEVSYLASQPWPFPASLMLGCRGEALTRDIVLDPLELEDALWITREDLLAVRAGESDRIKPARRGAIAHFLMERWLSDTLD